VRIPAENSSFNRMQNPDETADVSTVAEDLRRASRFGEDDEVCKLLEQAKAEGNLKPIISAPDSETGNRSLHFSGANGHQSIMRRLIDAGSDLDATNHVGSTALHYCAVGGQDKCAAMLLQAGADPFIENHSGCTALDEAHKFQRSGDVAGVLMDWANKIAKSVDEPDLGVDNAEDSDGNK
jgi:ankyrin repeat protein